MTGGSSAPDRVSSNDDADLDRLTDVDDTERTREETLAGDDSTALGRLWQRLQGLFGRR
jgi:hypothetical protein